jgi:hypothetical protein
MNIEWKVAKLPIMKMYNTKMEMEHMNLMENNLFEIYLRTNIPFANGILAS